MIHKVYGQPLDTEGLAGRLSLSLSDSHASYWTQDLLALLVEQDLGGVRYAAWVPTQRSLVADEVAMHAVTQIAVDRLRPWREPDRGGWPSAWTPFPSVAALGGLLATLHRRLIRAWEWIRWDWWIERRDR